MAVTLNLGSGGSVVASDPIASEHYQLVKPVFGLTGTATLVSATNPLPVTLANTAANATEVLVGVGTGATALGKAEDAVHASADVGVMALAVRKATAVNLSSLDGDYEPLQISAGRLWCSATIDAALPAGTAAIGKLAANSGVDIGDVDVTSVIPGSGATNLGKAEDAVHASADVGVMLLAVRKATAATLSDTDGDYEPLQISVGRLWTSATIDAALPAGTNAIGKLASNSGIDIGDIDVLSIAAGDNNIGNVDIVTVPTDPFGANADVGSTTGSISAKLKFIAATGIPITGSVAVTGTFWQATQPVSGTFWQATQPVSGTFWQATQPVSGTVTASNTAGDVAHDGVDSGNPVKAGAKAASSLATATMVIAADRTNLVSDLDGAVVVRQQFPLGDLLSERVADTGGTSTAFTNFGAVASTRNFITAIHIYNSSATNGFVDFRDGAAGAVLFTAAAPTVGGSVISCGGAPLFRSTANTAIAYDVSGALTTVYISVTGFQSKL